MLSRKIIETNDGSKTIYIPEWEESYHSRHGAVQEAYHVFISNGFDLLTDKNEISILEIGFGTGLNALITLLKSANSNKNINYTGLEKYPVVEEIADELNYFETLSLLNPNIDKSTVDDYYFRLIRAEIGKTVQILPNFSLLKIQTDFLEYDYPMDSFDLVYFDAFGHRVQPELWSKELFEKIYHSMKKGGLLTTYSSKGSVRRDLISLGFEVTKRPGPPGKREMMTAIKF